MAAVQHAHNPSQTNAPQSTSNTTSFRLNLDNSEQMPILHQNGGSTTGSTITSLHQATPVHVPSAMSTSLHSGSGAAPTFDVNTTSWNSTSSLSPTIPTAAHHHRKSEVKLNAMPLVFDFDCSYSCSIERFSIAAQNIQSVFFSSVLISDGFTVALHGMKPKIYYSHAKMVYF